MGTFIQDFRAYQILSDENKRRMYDETGSTDDSNPFAGFENEDMFNAFRGFGGAGRGGPMGGMGGF